jgi:protein involved in polysaccharide export with SLBB domain
MSLQTFAASVQAGLANGYYVAPTVNATLKHRLVAYGANVTQERLYVRILEADGAIANDSGWYPVRADGTLNLPYVGSVAARGRRLDAVEAEVQTGYRNQYINNAVVHVTPLDLDAV